MTQSSNLISVDALKQALLASAKLLDASWYLPTQGVDSRAAFQQAHIAGAQFFDIDLVCDQQSPYPHMLPNATQFSQAVGELGIGNDDTVIVYDTAGLFSAARVWWMFKVFGHEHIQVLQGGLPAWVANGGELTDLVIKPTATQYQATLEPSLLVDIEQLQSICKSPNRQENATLILDARPAGRFQGRDPEPRAGLSSGHMPGAVSLPVSELLDNGFLRPREQLRQIFSALNITTDSRLITTCGSGVTAAIITLALAECGFGLQQLYDGAWSEWAATVSPEWIIKDNA